MKKILIILPLIILSLISGCGGDTKDDTAELKKITIGIDEFAPMGFHDEKLNVVGFDTDLAKEAARRMGVEVRFKPIDWNSKEYEITSGNVDMIWNGCDIMDEYKAYMIFSEPYMDNRQILLVKAGNPQDIQSVADLAGKVVGTQAGSNSEIYIEQNKALRDSFAAFRTYPAINTGFDFLDGGEVDVLIIDEIAARYEMSKHPERFTLIDETVGPVTEFGIGFNKENTALRNKVQKVFDDMVADGTARKISEQWFGTDLIKTRR